MVINLETGSFARIRIFSLLVGTFFKAMSASLCLMGINDFQGIGFFRKGFVSGSIDSIWLNLFDSIRNSPNLIISLSKGVASPTLESNA